MFVAGKHFHPSPIFVGKERIILYIPKYFFVENVIACRCEFSKEKGGFVQMAVNVDEENESRKKK